MMDKLRSQGKRGPGLADNGGYGNGWGGTAKMVWPSGTAISNGEATGYDINSVDAEGATSVFGDTTLGTGLGNGTAVGGRDYDIC